MVAGADLSTSAVVVVFLVATAAAAVSVAPSCTFSTQSLSSLLSHGQTHPSPSNGVLEGGSMATIVQTMQALNEDDNGSVREGTELCPVVVSVVVVLCADDSMFFSSFWCSFWCSFGFCCLRCLSIDPRSPANGHGAWRCRRGRGRKKWRGRC